MALYEDLMSKCAEHLSAYKSACEEHTHLKSYDASLQQKTMKTIESIPVRAKPQSKSDSVSPYEVHKEVSQHMFEVTEGVAKFITESDHDVWENKALRDLVEAYFEITKETLKIFNTIQNCVDDAEMGQLLIRQAVADFEKESAEKDAGGKKKKYEKTLKDLKKFKAMGDPFDGQVLTIQFKLIKEQQESLMKEVGAAKQKILDEISNVEQEIVISNVVFGATVAIAAVISIVLISTCVGAVAGFGALCPSLLAAGWAGVYTILEKKKADLKKELDGLNELVDIEESVEKGIKTNEEATATVSTLVSGLEDRIHTMLALADNAIENEDDEEDTKLVLKVIKGKIDKLTEKIKEVGESVQEHSKLIAEARLHVLQKINRS
ncbi:PREDICTED: UPF0496 protein At3g28270-like [Camelina sativa]|uniref:UPF0496 protein At3g28270-like n=1 Tax=Camelina sativa TaxID=90675 RepID=A0ABM0YLH3_CAMSA|nr:PREDICTED: UPF0496 protein At3g28270-like [Camelina sativa]